MLYEIAISKRSKNNFSITIKIGSRYTKIEVNDKTEIIVVFPSKVKKA